MKVKVKWLVVSPPPVPGTRMYMRISFHGHKEHKEFKDIWGLPRPPNSFVVFVIFVAKVFINL